jgi:hypothetical protein
MRTDNGCIYPEKAWVAGDGDPGTYITLDPVKAGDEITITIPTGLRLTKYNGQEGDFRGREAYAWEYGPVLMVAVGKGVKDGVLKLPLKSAALLSHLRAVEGKPLHFTIAGVPDVEYMPYYEVNDEPFTSYPFFV